MLLLALREKILKSPNEYRGGADPNDKRDERNYKPGKYFHFIIDQRTIGEIQTDPEFTEYIIEKNSRFSTENLIPFVEAISGKNEKDILSQITPEMYDPGLERFLLQRYTHIPKNLSDTSPTEYEIPQDRRSFHTSSRSILQSSRAVSTIPKTIYDKFPETVRGKKRRYEEDDNEDLFPKRQNQYKTSENNTINSGFDFKDMQLPESEPLDMRDEVNYDILQSMPTNPLSLARMTDYKLNENENEDRGIDRDEDVSENEDMSENEDFNISDSLRQAEDDFDYGRKISKNSNKDYDGIVLNALVENDGDEGAAWKSLKKSEGPDVINNSHFISTMNRALVK